MFPVPPPGHTVGTMAVRSYEEACEQHRWEVPERYNIAGDVCDKHDPDKPAMVHEHFDGTVRELRWGEHRCDPRADPEAIRQIVEVLASGTVIDVCAGDPCTAAPVD